MLMEWEEVLQFPYFTGKHFIPYNYDSPQSIGAESESVQMTKRIVAETLY